MNVALHDRTIDSHLPALLHFRLPAVDHQNPINLLPGRPGNTFDVLGQRRFLETLIGYAQTAKPSQRVGIGQVKRQKLIAESKHLFDNSRSQNVLGAQAIGAGVSQVSAPTEILMNQINYGSILFQNQVDFLQFPGLGMVDCRVHQGQLLFTLFAHFVAAPFLILVVLSTACLLWLYHLNQKMSTTKCAFYSYSN
jgi:hypothetical protein